jgi:hypothetical protein
MKRFGVPIAFLSLLLLVAACGGNGVDEPTPTEPLPEATVDSDTPTPAVEDCLPSSEDTDNLFASDLGLDLYQERVEFSQADLPNFAFDKRRSHYYSREQLAKEDEYPLEKLGDLRRLGLLFEWRMKAQVNSLQVRQLSNDLYVVQDAFTWPTAPDPRSSQTL